MSEHDGVQAATIRSWLDRHRDRIVADLSHWAAVPSVAGLVDREGDMEQSADWLAARLRELGVPRVDVCRDYGPPAVFARWEVDPQAPNVFIYSHHDVRVAEADEWSIGAPFAPEVHGGRLYGRGTSDAKGQVLAHVWALQALCAAAAAPPVNVTLLVEGEEELGSPHLADHLAAHADDLDIDLVMVSDTMTWSSEQPAICVGNRGLIKGDVRIDGPRRESHSGAVSGVAPNPVNELLRVLGGLHDDDGRVAIPGFYDEVREVDEDEKVELRELGADEAAWLARTDLGAVIGERGRSLAERLYTRPSAEVLSLVAGDAESPTRGALPTSAGAQVQLSLVPDQRPEVITALLREWIAQRVSPDFGFDVDVPEEINQPPYETPPDHPAVPLLREAMSQAWQRPALRMRNAGGGPGALLAEALHAPVFYFGTGLPEDHWHAADESVDLEVLLKGTTALALFWDRLPGALTARA